MGSREVEHHLSPVLTEQLASTEFQKELAFYRENVLRACAESRSTSP